MLLRPTIHHILGKLGASTLTRINAAPLALRDH